MTSSTNNNDGYSVRALYDVIRFSLLTKDKELIHFIRTMNDNIVDDFEKIKKNNRLSLDDIFKKYENYAIVYMMIRHILEEAKISSFIENARDITNFFLTDELQKKNNKPQSPIYGDEDF
jgi:hypothetical protein